MRATVTIRGHRELGARLEQVADRLERPLEPLLSAWGDLALSFFQEHIRQGGGAAAAEAGSPWPPLDPLTQGIRRRRGYDQRPLMRKGDLLQSIRQISRTGNSVTVGTNHEIAAIVHDGGLETARYNRPGARQIPPRPFILFSQGEIEELMDTFDQHFFGDLLQ